MSSESCLGHYNPSVPVNPLNRVQKQLVNQCHPGQGRVVSGSGQGPSPAPPSRVLSQPRSCASSSLAEPQVPGREQFCKMCLAGPGTVTRSTREPGRKEPRNSCGAAPGGERRGPGHPDTEPVHPGARVPDIHVPVHPCIPVSMHLCTCACTRASLHTCTCAAADPQCLWAPQQPPSGRTLSPPCPPTLSPRPDPSVARLGLPCRCSCPC